MRPAVNAVASSEEPPCEKKGNAMPVAGRKPETTPRLERTWKLKSEKSPTTRKALKPEILDAVLKTLYPMKIQHANTKETPRRPVSSTKPENTKSDWISGIEVSFLVPSPSPLPQMPPDMIALIEF